MEYSVYVRYVRTPILCGRLVHASSNILLILFSVVLEFIHCCIGIYDVCTSLKEPYCRLGMFVRLLD